MGQEINIENRLHMYAYYGTLQWQILAIVLAGASLLATLPFLVTKPGLVKNPTLYLWYFVIDEFFAGASALVGILFQGEIRTLAHRWIHFENEDYRVSPRAWIDWIEHGKLEYRFPARPPRITGRHYVIAFSVLGVAYGIFLIVLWVWTS